MSDEKSCPNCGAALMPGDIFCGECGSRVEEPSYDLEVEMPTEKALPEAKEPTPLPEPQAAEYIPPPVDESPSYDTQVLRIVVIVAAAVFLLLSLCLCSFGGLVIASSSGTSTGEDLGITAAICFAPGVIFGLLGVGAAYFGIRRS